MHHCILIFIFIAIQMSAQAVEFTTTMSSGKRFTICRVDLAKEPLKLFLNDPAGQPLKTFAAVEAMLAVNQERLVFAMNAGMYHGNFSPVGLCVIDGQRLAPLNLENAEGNFFLKPNGVFLITDKGARVVESSQVPLLKDKLILATQSGPMLLGGGRRHPAFKQGSKNRLYRNGVGVVSPNVVVFAISEEPVNFHEFALLFRDDLHCADALFLDGTVSSLHAPSLKRSDKKMDLGPMFGITTTK